MKALPVFAAPSARRRPASAGLRLLLSALAVLWLGAAFALTFPALSGRVVDQADIINAATKADLERKLAELETKSGIQLVVASVRSLEGSDVETYANQLFRNWKLGEAKTNNGVLLLIAPNERKVRIEVGYGLEGTLTDALSKIIIANAIAPRFKAGDFSGGVLRGVDDIIAVLTTDASEWAKRPQVRAEDNGDALDPAVIFIAILLLIFIIMMINRNGGGRMGRSARNGGIFLPGPSSGSWGGGSWGGGGGGGSSWGGGGGSSGGGGASGDW